MSQTRRNDALGRAAAQLIDLPSVSAVEVHRDVEVVPYLEVVVESTRLSPSACGVLAREGLGVGGIRRRDAQHVVAVVH
ncbi:hypothetical protein ACFQKF_09410 [Halalkalicoccus sp. GCM10025322]|uniref:hypothetical protein n=1 Tax=Halalkalicoccus TaxID=332246 RepID=UPI002F96E920